jgi:hypothetical protein
MPEEAPAPLYLCLPTRDGTAAVRSVETFQFLALSLRRPLMIVMAEASNIPRARNAIHDGLRQMDVPPLTKLWWMDSDIVFTAEALPHLVRMMSIGDAEPASVLVAAHYRMSDGRWQGMAGPGFVEHVSGPRPGREHSGRKKDRSGFGLVYGVTDPEYVWMADTLGEDVHWWMDHPDARVIWYEAWGPLHRKGVLL